MIGYIAVGVTCLFIGGFVGVFTLSLCITAKERDEINDNRSDDPCKDCFGASMGDCDHCNKNLMNTLDDELSKCIQKLRNAVYGYEVRTFITEYEELMLKKSDAVVKEFLKKENK